MLIKVIEQEVMVKGDSLKVKETVKEAVLFFERSVQPFMCCKTLVHDMLV